MTKVNIKRLDSVTKNDTTATEQINDNFQALQAAIENTVSRDGTVPNYMDADLDLNSYRIINAGDPVNEHDVVTVKYFEEQAGGAIEAAAESKASASKAASSAQSALVASNNAIGQLAQAEGLLVAAGAQLEETRTYVEEAVTDIAEIRDNAVETVDKAVADALDGVKKEAVDAATNVIDSVVGQYTGRAEAAANNAEADATNAAESATLAAEDANDAAHWAEDARIWAAGSDTEVNTIAPNQGKHSAETYASMAATSANLAEIKNKITNCITEIPQNIKLELSNGTLTLKAGSKVYVPNGAGKFDEVTVASDKVVGQAGTVSGAFAFYRSDNGSCYSAATHGLSSGTTAPSNPAVTTTWYDTTNNVIKVYDGTAWRSGVAFPLCRFTNNNSSVTSIDQVFNGFGYIGSTVFALPGVKGLIPNGRNADGSLKNIEFTVPNVITRTITWNNAGGQHLFLGKYGLDRNLEFISTGAMSTYYIQENEPAKYEYSIWYNPTTNKQKRFINNTNWTDVFCVYLGTWFSSGTSPYPITKLTTALPFRAVDQNDFDREAVKTSGDQTIDGVKTFSDIIRRSSAFGGGGTSVIESADSNNKGLIALKPYYTSNTIYNRLFAQNSTANKNAYVDISIKDAGTSNIQLYADTVIAPTPESNSNGTNIATTAWVNTRGISLKYASGVAVTVADGGTYTAPSRGVLILFLDTKENDLWTYVYCNGKQVGMAHGKSSRSNGDATIFIPVAAGDKITRDSNFNKVEGHFYPYGV